MRSIGVGAGSWGLCYRPRCLAANIPHIPHGGAAPPGDPAGNETNQTQYSFQKAFKECLTSFTFDFIGLAAGFIFAYFLGIFMMAPWAIAVYPAVLTAKGVIGGLLSGRLSTALHIGLVYPKFTGNTRAFYRLFDVIMVVNLITSLLMSSIAIVFGKLFWGIEIGNIIEIVLNVIATMAMGLSISLLAAYVSFCSFKFGWDPDVVVYPVMSSTADTIITIYYALTIFIFFLPGALGKAIIVAINVVYIAASILVVLRNLHDEEFIKSVKEILLTLIIIAFIVNVTGTFLDRISAIIEERREVYTVYPSLIDMIGDVGSVVGSIATTKLALGLIYPSIKDLSKLKEHISASWIASLIIFMALSIASVVINGIFELSCLAWLTLILVIVNLITVPLILLISYSISILTFKRGFDPDNFVIPIESSLADSLATLSLLFAILLIPG